LQIKIKLLTLQCENEDDMEKYRNRLADEMLSWKLRVMVLSKLSLAVKNL